MTELELSRREAAEFGIRLEALSDQFSPRERAFLQAVLRLAAADAWAHTNGSPPGSTIRDLILDIQEAGSSDAISRNPLPLPPH